LDPISLTTVAKTCRYWRHIVTDDVCCKWSFCLHLKEHWFIDKYFWVFLSLGKNAFLAYFGQLPYKRLRATSWKAEYILRTHLIRYDVPLPSPTLVLGLTPLCFACTRKWEKGRGRLLTFNPKIGSIDGLLVDYDNSFMMVASEEQGKKGHVCRRMCTDSVSCRCGCQM
jgi:hypothetical protein